MHDSPASIFRDVSLTDVSNGIVGFIFAATVPVALAIAALSNGGMADEAHLGGWIFGGFVINGFLTLAFSLRYRQPLVFLWSIPGTVLVGQALTHLSVAEVTGAYIATGLFVFVLGVTGLVNFAMAAIPMPIVMAMVAGIFIQFGMAWLDAFKTDFWVAAIMTATFLGLTAFPRATRFAPPVIVTLIAGIATAVLLGETTHAPSLALNLALPRLTAPEFSWAAMIELVVPLAITVIVVQNGQGIAVMSSVGHAVPVNKATAACGLGAVLTATVGTVSTCLAGLVIGVITTSERPERQYVAALVLGSLGILFGLSATMIAQLALAAPKGLIGALAGLAMLRVLQHAFTAAFSGRQPMSALVTFLITSSGMSIANIGAPFWGIVCGYLFARLVERQRDERPNVDAAVEGRPGQ
jgi:benzoate membrane transport protein